MNRVCAALFLCLTIGSCSGNTDKEYQRAKEAMDKDDHDLAIACATEAIRENPKHSKAYAIRGSAHFNKGDTGKAITDYTEAIRLDSKNAYALTWRANAYHRLRELQRARNDVDEALRIGFEKPQQKAMAHAVRGDILVSLSLLKEGSTECDESLKIDPQNALAYAARSRAKVIAGQFKEGLADLRKAVQLDRSHQSSLDRLEEQIRFLER